MEIKFVIPCLLGLEGLIADELRAMDAENVTAENGRVLFSGNEYTLARANINSRFAERVQILVGTFQAKSFEELFEGTKSLPWEQWIGKRDAFPVKGYSINSALFSVSDCQAIIKKAIVERLKTTYKIPWFEETGSLYQVQFSILKDKVSLLIDTTGAGLHKRGYRPAANSAPIKETLAAAIASLARVRGNHTLYDPMCGSGTILIEGAMLAHNIAPGIGRDFTADRWGNLPADIWKTERERALDLMDFSGSFMAYGSDIDANSIEIATENISRAGLTSKIKLSVADLKDFSPQTEKGTLICNPPYGERMMETKEVEALHRLMGEKFVSRRGWSYSVISPSEVFEDSFGRRADKRRKLYNGMIKCQLFMYFK